jgi:AraC-like DNA-binding protein
MTDFILYSRYIHSLVATHSSSDPLTTVALRSGFYDQSHFIRTFKSFTGISPGDYRRRQSNVVGHLYQTGEAMAV